MRKMLYIREYKKQVEIGEYVKIIDKTVNEIADHLDEIDKDWFLKVNSEEIRMASCFNCVIGQIFSDFSGGISLIEAKRQARFDLCQMGAVSSEYAVPYWIREIESRLNRNECA